MSLSYIEMYNLSVDGEFQVKLAGALAAYIPGVLNEPDTTASHVERVALAMKVLVDPLSFAKQISLSVAAALDLASPSDAEMLAIVDQYWTVCALNQTP